MFNRDTADTIESMVDVYNHRHADALLLVARYYFGVDGATEAAIAEVNESRLLLTVDTGERQVRETLAFETEPDSANAVADNLLLCVALARENAPGSVPQTRIERDIQRSSELQTYHSTVTASRRISSNIVAITFRGGLQGLPDIGNDAFLFVIVPRDRQRAFAPDFSMASYRNAVANQASPDYHGAYYTIRNQRENEIEVWFVLHPNPGPLARWAAEAREGDPVALWGPRSTFDPPEDTRHYLFIADETAQAAVLSTIEGLAGASYHCLFETEDESSRYTLADHLASVEWIYRRGQRAGRAEGLSHRLAELAVTSDQLYVFGAGEGKQMSALRRQLVARFQLQRAQVNLTGYWRLTGP